jgi:hypothetical protein
MSEKIEVFEQIIDLINAHPDSTPEELAKIANVDVNIFKMRMSMMPAYIEKRLEAVKEQ